ncbi:MAG: type II toxin-antitoxin system RelE/ParE family toxin [Candidatus Tectomicrobia bacterium]|uniref:Type II toxin-antitoxin system RelE/ParE family toxin n=1 Tax=Tectimicrobiota bacterium TaxID=2528274 RepID=A0A932GLS2_UNCTE|nr:type II toxin-antitoxin system RelE/ParE family toxin [Candidatus Tectomicrobia bacterium]
MAARARKPVFTENFVNNLESILLFLEPEGADAFQHLLARISDDIVPTLCRFPQSGRSFLAHPVRSLEAQALIKQLKRLLRKGDDLREFVLDDYLILYLLRGNQVIFLSIKHHRQLSFDFRNIWP